MPFSSGHSVWYHWLFGLIRDASFMIPTTIDIIISLGIAFIPATVAQI